ncbi:succinate dehydrogenase, hydrophobic membrane anchor protein [bacterium SCSIO 12696]|nr:succinate dehydrogenase, hydrophobic membrane anchor protein [bacterium SCSIO 12696]
MGLMSGNGTRQWVFQRLSNALTVVFGIVMLKVLMSNDLSHESLVALFSGQAFQIYAGLTLLFVCFNSILAGWQIEGDYQKKLHIPKNLLTTVAVVLSLCYLVCGLMLLFR